MSELKWNSVKVKPNNYQECIVLVCKKDGTRRVKCGEFWSNGTDDCGTFYKCGTRKQLKGKVIAWMEWPGAEEEIEEEAASYE